MEVVYFWVAWPGKIQQIKLKEASTQTVGTVERPFPACEPHWAVVTLIVVKIKGAAAEI